MIPKTLEKSIFYSPWEEHVTIPYNLVGFDFIHLIIMDLLIKCDSYPVLSAIFTKPFLFFSFSLAEPGKASSDSAAPPMTIMAAFPVP